MIESLVVLYLLTLGKIVGQQTFSSPVILPQAAPISFLDRRTGQYRDINSQYTAHPPSQLVQYSAKLTNRDQQKLYSPRSGSDDLYHPLSSAPTVRENQPKRRLFISRRVSERMSGHRPSNETRVKSNNKTSVQNTNIYDNVKCEEENPAAPRNLGNPTDSISQTATPGSLPKTNPPVSKPVSPVSGVAGNVPQVTQITLDERASFDGDQCPTGYVRVNGMCVLPD